MAQYRIPSFTGLNTFLQAHLLQPGEATELSNARVKDGSVVSVNAPGVTTDEPADLVLDPLGTRSILLYNGKRYWTDNDGTAGASSDEGFLGVDPPTNKPTVVPQGAGDIFNGRYKHACTFVTDTGFESAPIELAQRINFSSEVTGEREIASGASLSSIARAWDSSANYGPAEIVTNQGKLWKCLQGHDNQESGEKPVQIRLFTLVDDGDELELFNYPVNGARRTWQITATVVIPIQNDPTPPFENFSIKKRTGNEVGDTITITNSRGKRPSEIATYSGFSVSGVVVNDFVVNYKEVLYTNAPVSQFSEPGVGDIWGNYWVEIEDTVASTEPEIHGASSFLVTNIPISQQAAVTKRNVYRTIDGGSTFYLVGEVLDNLTREFVDRMPDELAQLRPALDSLDNYPPVQVVTNDANEFETREGKYLVESNGTFFIAESNKLYLSRPGNPHVYPPLNNVPFDDTITGLVEVPDGVLVYTENRTYRIVGTNSQDIFKRIIPNAQGVKNWRTIDRIRNAPIWQSNDGLAVWNGEGVDLITDGRIDVDFDGTYSFVANEAYHLVGPEKTLVADFRGGLTFYERTDINSTVYPNGIYDSFEDKAYLVDVPQAYYEDGTGSQSEYTYRTPELDAEDLSQSKHWRAIWVTTDGDVTVEVFFEGVLQTTLNLTGSGRKRSWLPAGLVGHEIAFRFTGTGTYRELSLEFTPMKKIS